MDETKEALIKNTGAIYISEAGISYYSVYGARSGY